MPHDVQHTLAHRICPAVCCRFCLSQFIIFAEIGLKTRLYVCVFRRATSLFTRGFPRHRAPDASQHCILHCSLLRGCKAAPLHWAAFHPAFSLLQGAQLSRAQPGICSKSFSSLQVTAVSGKMFLHCLYKKKNPQRVCICKNI